VRSTADDFSDRPICEALAIGDYQRNHARDFKMENIENLWNSKAEDKIISLLQ
jgi:hypothetical protein